jgi:hypothetical protein
MNAVTIWTTLRARVDSISARFFRSPERTWRRLLLVSLAVLATVLWVAVAMARPGGGSSYSGGTTRPSSGGGTSHSSGGSSSGGSSSGDALVGFLFELLFEAVVWLVLNHPTVGVPLLLGIAVLVFAFSIKRHWVGVIAIFAFIGTAILFQISAVGGGVATALMLLAGLLYGRLFPETGWSTPVPEIEPAIPTVPTPSPGPALQPRANLERIRTIDPDFSTVLFEDFAYLLYAEVHRARGDNALDRVAPYVSEATRTRLAARPVSAVRDVVIASMRIVSVTGVEPDPTGQARVSVIVEFDANYTEVDRQAREQGYWVVEQWTLVRAQGAKSKPPEKSTVLPCPSCGAPLDVSVGGACKYCKKVVEDESFSWRVELVTPVRREERAPVLTADVAEQGTDWPTVFSPDVGERLAAIKARDVALDMVTVRQRVEQIFSALQVSWTARDLTNVRPFVSDNLFQSLGYWITAYRKAKLKNVIEQPAVSELEVARVSSDRYFDAITLRVFASSLDYVVDEQDKLVSGSRDTSRVYSEYWTLIRSAARAGAAPDPAECPSCGAPLDINMAGSCKSCNARVTTGEFDWVLSRIEQDETYTG